MPISSISIIRLKVSPFSSFRRLSAFEFRRCLFSTSCQGAICSSRYQNPRQDVSRKPQPNKSLLKARESVRQLSSLAPVLSPEDKLQLDQNEAIGLVAASQANFMRVIVQSFPSGFTSGTGGLNQTGPGDQGDGIELLCVVRALLKKIKRKVLVGDRVLVGSIDWTDRRGMIENVFQRKTEISDPPIANVDHLVVFFSMDQPKLEAFSLTRFLVEAESTGIPFTLALNKAELCTEQTISAWKSKLRSWGYEPIFCSVESKYGIDTLQFNLREQTSVVVGPSGVGKSSLINVLRSSKRGLDADDNNNWFAPILGSNWFEMQRVGEVSSRSGRGKHVTRHISLLPLSDRGYLADTPGFNQPTLMKVSKQSLAQYFPEIRKMLKENESAKCTFNDCLHIGEPGCIVRGDWERYPYYLQLLDEIKIREEFQLRTMGTKREGDVRFKMGDMGIKQAEPRLEPKKHRRTSRKRINQSMLDELDEFDDDEEQTTT